MQDEDHGATVRAWTDVIRRAQFDKVIPGTHPGRFVKGSTVKAVAVVIASYADANGRRVFPGVARLAADLQIGYRVAGRCVVGLRELGLIERVRRAVRRGARSEREQTDEYRLTLPPDLLERLTLPTPSDFREIVARVARPHRPMSEARLDSPVQAAHSARSDSPADTVSNRVSDTNSGESIGVTGRNLTVSQTAATLVTDLDTSTTSHPESNLGFEAAAPHASEAEAEEPNFDVGVTGPPSLHVVTGSARGTPPPQRGFWPASVPALADSLISMDQVARAPIAQLTPGELAIANVRRLLQDRKRGRASA